MMMIIMIIIYSDTLTKMASHCACAGTDGIKMNKNCEQKMKRWNLRRERKV